MAFEAGISLGLGIASALISVARGGRVLWLAC